MIYAVSKQLPLFSCDDIKFVSVKESLEVLNKMECVQADGETNGLNTFLCKLLTFQLGNKQDQVVIDTTTVDLKEYKGLMESKKLFFHNANFDLQFLYKEGIVPRKVYDTMIAEQVLYLGYPKEQKSYSLAAVVEERLGLSMDKSIRTNIERLGFCESVIRYGAYDVTLLEDVAKSQLAEAKRKQCVQAILLECKFVPAMAYLEFCGIKLDETKWRLKMDKDQKALEESQTSLNNWLRAKAAKDPRFRKFIQQQLNLFGYEPDILINWNASGQVIELLKMLGFNTEVKDKETGENKDSALEKALAIQRGIDDDFLEKYFAYKGAVKVVTSFGQNFLNAINPITNRLHFHYKCIGASSSRMSSGGGKDKDIAIYKHILEKECPNPNGQQLPHDAETRACFVSEPGNLFVSCDYSSQEGYMQAEIYDEPVLKEMYRNGLDSHSVNAKIFFKDELKNIPVEKVKELRPDLRGKAKSPFFALSYGGSASTLVTSLGISKKEAQDIVKNYQEGYKATMDFARRGSMFVRKYGYILINKQTGLKLWWWDHKQWLKDEEYLQEHPEERRSSKFKTHNKAAAKYDRLARNAPSQGSSASMSKTAVTNLFNWIVDNNYFEKVKIVSMVHDEVSCEFPDTEEFADFPKRLEKFMVDAGKIFVTSLDMKAVAETGTHWIH